MKASRRPSVSLPQWESSYNHCLRSIEKRRRRGQASEEHRVRRLNEIVALEELLTEELCPC
ncbi:AAEL007272-PA [Aedes aegypti]|uniref:AAEL007272-PA n=1 Tax=Aedes aegypti TaxID=7159 RepID=Q172U6_AEDAE|nr:AAEL007272-PA [Aedes aegypti]